MTTTSRIHLDLPPDLYARIRAAAERSGRPVEAVLVESLDLLFGTPSGDWDHLAAPVEALSDGHLWALVYRRMAWAESARLRELTAHGTQGALTEAEQVELAALIDHADGLTLLRSRAMLVLQERGHNVREQLRLGA